MAQQSHPSRGAWIEISKITRFHGMESSRTPHGVRGLKFKNFMINPLRTGSHPSRGAWIEIRLMYSAIFRSTVAPLTGCVD